MEADVQFCPHALSFFDGLLRAHLKNSLANASTCLEPDALDRPQQENGALASGGSASGPSFGPTSSLAVY